MGNKKKIIEVQGTKITIFSHLKEEYISITDIARYKDSKRTDYIIQNWMRNRNTIEFLGIWKRLNNPRFNPIEFDGFRKRSEKIHKLMKQKLEINASQISDIIGITQRAVEMQISKLNEQGRIRHIGTDKGGD